MHKLHDFWRNYPRYDVHSIKSVNDYHVFHPEDLTFLYEFYPHFFEPITSLKGRKLSERIKIERLGHPIRQNDLMNIEFLAYASESREDITYLNKLLPSQSVATEEVRCAIRKGVYTIVRSTDRSRWIQHVPELINYEHLFVFTNYKQPSLHPNEVMRYETFKARDILKATNRLKEVQQEDYRLLMNRFK